MNAPVTDPYAARLGARLYQELATRQRPDPLVAVSEASVPEPVFVTVMACGLTGNPR